ncbi:MAG: PLP-dependent aminotransferase family protein [Leptolyngbya sp. RL_3_1]|nr:PLP-dependent aminotransferase family protein [Leptolyngbya sp. RL_3_1]
MDLVLTLDRTAPLPLYQQLAAALREAVLQGRLQPHQPLPSSRRLAQSLQVSRSTVTQSYDQLLSEGYFEARGGSGTFVCAQLPDEYLHSAEMEPQRSRPAELTQLSRLGQTLLADVPLQVADPKGGISFRLSSPDTSQFPIQLWRRLLSRHCQQTSARLNYGPDALGYGPLRAAIADYLRRSRAVQCSAEQVIIVSGSQQGLDLMARLTIDPGDQVALEDPGYLGARRCFASYGAQLQGIPVDAAGLDIEALRHHHQPFKWLYVTPSHQFPTGATLSLSRRLALLQWAQQTGTLILEDDYDSEYRYGDRPIPALQGLDQRSVIYTGTFSKILFPALRIGYLVVPEPWIPLVNRAKWLCDRQAPPLTQSALTDFITEGHFERHIRRMRHRYDQRRQVLVNALKDHLGDRVTILGEKAGIHLMAKIETGLSDQAVIQRAADVGVGVISAQGYYLNAPNRGEFIFGYAQLDAAQIEQGIQQLAQVLKGEITWWSRDVEWHWSI